MKKLVNVNVSFQVLVPIDTSKGLSDQVMRYVDSYYPKKIDETPIEMTGEYAEFCSKVVELT